MSDEEQQHQTRSGRSGDGASFAALYVTQVHRYFLRRLRRPEDADDLAQEVFLRMLRLNDARWIDKPLAYLYTVAAHVLFDWRMNSGREREHLTIDSDTVEKLLDAPPTVQLAALEERLNLQQQLDKTLAQLPPVHQAVLLLRKRDGLSHKEIARKLGLSIHTVEKYIVEATARFRTELWDK